MVKKILAIIIIGLVLFGAYQLFFKTNGPKYISEKVKYGQVLQEVSENGTVKMGEEINLGFKNSGTIEKIYIEVGKNVKEGDVLVELDKTTLYIQFQEANSALAISQAKLDKLLAGAAPEEIQQAKTAVSNAETTLTSSRQNLEDVTAQAKDSLDSDYQDALNVLNDSYLKSYNAQNTVGSIERTYFYKNDQEGVKVKENREAIEKWVLQIKSYLDKAKADSAKENIDIALSKTKNSLSGIYDSLRIIREICEEPNYRGVVSATDKTFLDTQKTNINTALTNTVNAEQTISSIRLANDFNINTAKASVSTAEGSVQAAKDDLTLLAAPPRKEDIDLYRAQVTKDESQIHLLENQILETGLKSPVAGKVTEIKKRAGEQVQSALKDTVVVILPATSFNIKVDIYEEDVVRVAIGNPVDITLVAFPGQILKGKLISINPAEKIIDGVVYYEATVIFDEAPLAVKPGMTADLTIKASSRENVLVIPTEAVQKKDGKTFIQILKAGKPEEKEIITGLWGTNDLVEVISGLSEGEEIILQ